MVAAAAMAAASALGQANAPFVKGDLFRAVQMYADGNYNGCIDQLADIDTDLLSAQQREEWMLYRAIAYVHIDKAIAAQLLDKFLTDYPESTSRWTAMLNLADCYYGVDYTRALSIYRNISPDGLAGQQNDDLRYRMAYCYLQTDQYDLALPLFEDLASSTAYRNAAVFYQGFIAYDTKDYARARELFGQTNTSEAPGDMADYYLSQIYYVDGDNEKALATARKVIARNGTPT